MSMRVPDLGEFDVTCRCCRTTLRVRPPQPPPNVVNKPELSQAAVDWLAELLWAESHAPADAEGQIRKRDRVAGLVEIGKRDGYLDEVLRQRSAAKGAT